MEIPIKMDDLGVPTIFGNIHIIILAKGLLIILNDRAIGRFQKSGVRQLRLVVDL